MPLPLIMAGIGVASQFAKGIANYSAARKTSKMADSMQKKADSLLNQTIDKYKVSSALSDASAMAKNLYNSNSVADAVNQNANMSAGVMASNIDRSAQTSGASAQGAVIAEMAAMQAKNQGAVQQSSQQFDAARLVAGIAGQQEQANQNAYKFNTLLPYEMNMQRGMSLEQNALQGKIYAQRMKTAAFGDMMNGLASTAMTIGNAWGTGTGFDFKKAATATDTTTMSGSGDGMGFGMNS